jgi:hypothetical protein
LLSNEVKTPVGVVWWEGDLTLDSVINLPRGGTVPLQSWIGRTNGDCLEWLADEPVAKHGSHNQKDHAGRRGGYDTSAAEEAQSQLELDMDYIMGRTVMPSDYTGYRPGYTPLFVMPNPPRLSERVSRARRRIRRWASEREQRRLSRLSPAEIEEIKAANRARVAAQRERQVRVVRPQLGGFGVPALAKAFDPLFEMLERVLGDVVEPELWIALIEDGSPVAEMSGPLGDLLDEMLLAVLVDDAVVKHLQGQHDQQTHAHGGGSDLPKGWKEGDSNDSYTVLNGPNGTRVEISKERSIPQDRINIMLQDISTLQDIAPVADLQVRVGSEAFKTLELGDGVQGFVPMDSDFVPLGADSGTPQIYLRPSAITVGTLGSEGQLMPVFGSQPWRYTMIHEYGHVIDQRSTSKSDSDFDRMYMSSDQVGLSRYGQGNGREAFAEAWVGWIGTEGQTTKPFVRFYADRYGWDAGGEGRAPSAPMAKQVGKVLIVADTFGPDGAQQIWVDREVLYPSVQKHLQGKHDQQTHGKGGGGSETSERTATGRVPWGTIDNGDDFKVMLADEYRFAGGPSPVQGADEYRLRTAYKQHVASTLSARMEDVSTEDLVAACMVPQPIGDPPLKYAQLLADSKDENMAVITLGDGTVSVSQLDGPRSISSLREAGYNAVQGGTPEAEQAIRQYAVSAMVKQWAKTSNDADVLSLSIQRAAEDEFDAKGSKAPSEYGIREIERNIMRRVYERVDDHYAATGPTLRAFVRAQYDQTQEMFARAGVTDVVVHRGRTEPEDVVAAIPLGGQDVTARLRPLSSWATAPEVAENFAQATDPGRSGVVMRATVPVTRILSTPVTGVGCFEEYEVVVIGPSIEANMDAPFNDL